MHAGWIQVNDEDYESINSLKMQESNKIWKFLVGISVLTLFVLVILAGFFQSNLAWQFYFFGIFMLAIWLTLRVLELEARIEELKLGAEEQKEKE